MSTITQQQEDMKKTCKSLRPMMMQMHLDQQKQMQPTTDENQCSWTPGKKFFGKGLYGETKEVCCNTVANCGYAMKVQECKHFNRYGEPSCESWEKAIKREVKIQQLFAQEGVAPMIYDAWFCDNTAYIVMEPLHYNADQFIKRCVNDNIPVESIKDEIKKMELQTLELVRIAHKKGLAHLDLHHENIGLILTSPTSHEVKQVKLIDFGKSKQYKTQKEADLEESEDDIKMTFNLLTDLLEIELRWKKNHTIYRMFSPPQAPTKKPPQTSYKTPYAQVLSPKSPATPMKRLRYFESEDEDEDDSNSSMPIKNSLFDTDEDDDEDEKRSPFKRPNFGLNNIDEEDDSFIKKGSRSPLQFSDDEDNDSSASNISPVRLPSFHIRSHHRAKTSHF